MSLRRLAASSFSFALFTLPLAAQSGQPPVTPQPGDVVTRFDLVGVTSPGGNLTGFFTYDFTQHGWVSVEIHFNGTAASYGNPFSDPVHVSATGLSGSHNSQTYSYDFDLPFAQALTATTGSLVAIDPPNTPVSQLNAWYSIDNGNSASIYPITGGAIVPVVPTWYELGFAKAGSTATPHLAGVGTLTANSANHLDLTAAAPLSFAALVLGFDQQNLPFLGGTLVPRADAVLLLPTSSTGTASQTFTWPAGLPVHTLLFAQCWVLDAGVSQGVSASNGVRGASS